MSYEGTLLTVRQVARACNRTEETVRRWIWSGKLPAKKLGNQLFVERDDLARFRGEVVLAAEASPAYGTEKLPYTPLPYDTEEALRRLEAAVQFGKKLGEKYGRYDVVEAIRRHRDEGH
jgi:excisionase family DNA binding protein